MFARIKTAFENWLKERKESKHYLGRFKQAEKSGLTDKYGLTGTNGLLPGIGFVTMSYSRGDKDNVFVQADEEVEGRAWKRMKLGEAKAHGEKIIRCHYCENPAVSLDHGYNWQVERNACEDHLHTFDEMMNQGKKRK